MRRRIVSRQQEERNPLTVPLTKTLSVEGTARPMDVDFSDDDSEVSEDDLSEDEGDGQLFSMGMTRQEKIDARKPWRTSLIIKLIGRKIGYQFLLRRLQTMWRIKSPFMLIDLPCDFFIVRFTSKEEYCKALLTGPWMIDDHYLHVQQWKPNFIAEEAIITHLPVWIRFPKLPVEYFSAQ